MILSFKVNENYFEWRELVGESNTRLCHIIQVLMVFLLLEWYWIEV
jgi:hypothetical protein